MSMTWSLICSRRNVGVGARWRIWSRARCSCSAGSTKAERASECCPAYPIGLRPFSIRPASAQ